jgi:uncharacterized membrane protein
LGVSLLQPTARAVLALAAVLLGLAALILRARRADERLRAAVLAAAIGCLVLVLGERVLSLYARAAAPPGATFNEWRWVLSAPWGRIGLAIGITVAAAALIIGVLGTRREARPMRRITLCTLRGAALGAALVLYIQPALELRHVTREPNHVAVLVDDSLSMSLAERKGGPTRAERAAALLAASDEALARWRQDHAVDFYTFSDGLSPAGEEALRAKITPRGDATDLRQALEAVRARYDGRELAGVVLISDGVPTGRFADGVADGSARDFLADLGVRVHTVWVGRRGLADISVARVEADDFAFVRTAVRIDAVIRQSGLPPRDVVVTLERDGAPVKTVTVHLGEGDAEARASFEIVPERIGKFVYRISVPVADEEAIESNNARAFVLRVIRDKVRVLQLAGRPSWDERALRAFCKTNPNYDLVSLFILRTGDDIQIVPPEELSLIPFPTEELFEEQLGSFDVVVVQNFELARYGIGPYLENLRAYVGAGGGLAVVGGDLAFSSGGYAGSALTEALPVALLPEGTPAEALVDTAEFRPHLTAEGLRHPVTRLRFDRRENEARWAALPPLAGVNLVAGATPKAVVLADHPSLRTASGAPMPVLAVGEYGQGRSLALTTDTAWRWGFVAAERPGDDGRAFAVFWENAIRWLIRDPELEYLHVESDQAEYPPGASPRLAVRLVDKDYRPAAGQRVRVELARADSATRGPAILERAVETGEGGEAILPVPGLSPGAYRATARATVSDREVVADDVFLIRPEREELARPAAREDILAAVAEATGGKHLGGVSVLDPALLFAPPRVVRIDRKSDVELWSRPHLLVLALLFFGAEWALRRRG